MPRAFPKATYFFLEELSIVARLRADPHGFRDSVTLPVILDQGRNVLEIFGLVRAHIDQWPRRLGQWLLTGSQEAPLMHGVTEFTAGRAAALQLCSLSTREESEVSLLPGEYP